MRLLFIGMLATAAAQSQREAPVPETNPYTTGADVGLSTTGVAGPEPHDGHDPGTVWVAVDAADRSHARGFHVRGERDRVIRWAQQAALDLARRYLDGRPLPTSGPTV